MKENLIRTAAVQYGEEPVEILALTEGLIHHTYKVSFQKGQAILLQYINQSVFKEPEKLISNYQLLQSHLSDKNTIKIPRLLSIHTGDFFWVDDEQRFWRAFEFIENSYSSNSIKNSDQAFSVANCFGRFTKSLAGFEINQLHIAIPQFHDLGLRYNQFNDALIKALPERLTAGNEIVEGLRNRNKLVVFYQGLDDKNYPLRIMHHDCKVNNVLFDKNTDKIICLVDLDTVMPGRFFSDVGDMIRTMACTRDEDSIDWRNISIEPDIYKSIIKGYLEGMGDSLTNVELENIHYSGLLMIYMQCLRFMADYLNNDTYYKINYKEQNLHRAYNQYLLLKELEVFLKTEYNFRPYN